MRLFYSPGTSSLFPHIVLHEAGLAFEGIRVDEHTKIMANGEDYRTINPLGFVPALQLDAQERAPQVSSHDGRGVDLGAIAALRGVPRLPLANLVSARLDGKAGGSPLRKSVLQPAGLEA
jgi:hypothetical protein